MTIGFNDSHRLFLQSMLSKRIVLEEDAIRLFNKVLDITNAQQDDHQEYNNFISTINQALDSLDYSLKIGHNEATGDRYLVMTNVKQDSMTELATNYTPVELSYIRELFDMMINADHENFGISTMTAIHLGGKIKPVKLSSKETQDLLERLVQDKWIGLESKGAYYLDIRAIAELQDYFRDLYGDALKECTICFEIVTMGEHCEVSECSVRLHKFCANKRFNNVSRPTCPQCSTPWNRSNVFGLGMPDQDN